MAMPTAFNVTRRLFHDGQEADQEGGVLRLHVVLGECDRGPIDIFIVHLYDLPKTHHL